MGSGMSLLDDLDARRERVARDRENSARLAQSYVVFKTTGSGTIYYEDRVSFGLTFIEKPIVSYCCEINTDDLANLLNAEVETPDDGDPDLPHVTGFVVKWDQDERDFYTGCWVAVRVETIDDGEGVVQIEVRHHFTFAAVGLKDIPVDTTDSVD